MTLKIETDEIKGVYIEYNKRPVLNRPDLGSFGRSKFFKGNRA